MAEIDVAEQDYLQGKENQSVGYPNDRLATRARKVAGQQYHVARLIQPSKNLIFRAFTPETFNLSIQNNWEPIFGDIGDSRSSQAGRAAAAVGMPINLKYFTRQIWMGTEPLHFSFTFQLDAYGDTEKDVEEPIINLLKMSTPKRKDSGFLESPGPSMISDENRIYMRIGKFFFLDSVVIQNVDITFYTVVSKADGRYMSADINVSLTTAYTPDQDDILAYFNRGNSLDDSGLNPGNGLGAAGDYVKTIQNTIANGMQSSQDLQGRAVTTIQNMFGRGR